MFFSGTSRSSSWLTCTRTPKAIGLDLERFDREMNEHTYASKVQEDIRTAAQDGVQGTPTLFINGMRYDGPRDYPSMLATVLALGAGAA